jgi:hypothetical protein
LIAVDPVPDDEYMGGIKDNSCINIKGLVLLAKIDYYLK